MRRSLTALLLFVPALSAPAWGGALRVPVPVVATEHRLLTPEMLGPAPDPVRFDVVTQSGTAYLSAASGELVVEHHFNCSLCFPYQTSSHLSFDVPDVGEGTTSVVVMIEDTAGPVPPGIVRTTSWSVRPALSSAQLGSVVVSGGGVCAGVPPTNDPFLCFSRPPSPASSILQLPPGDHVEADFVLSLAASPPPLGVDQTLGAKLSIFALAPDPDNDGVASLVDNCSAAGNTSQLDTDGDGIGNACDCDFNQDGACSVADFNAFLPDFLAGHDGGTGTDMDGDGVVGIGDFNLFLPGFLSSKPGPSGTAKG